MKQSPLHNIRPDELKEALTKNQTILIDVRTDAEYTQEHIPGSFHVPLDTIKEHKRALAKIGKSVTFICRSGKRATEACEAVKSAGLKNAAVLEGGMLAWTGASGTTVKTSLWSLERQVRGVAGALALTGTVLAMAINPQWIALSGIVGAGLLFAAITDTCGMAFVLARMPWNRSRTTDVHSEVKRLHAMRG